MGGNFKITIRTLFRRKKHAFLNIFGLVAGLAGCLLILYHVTNDSSCDRENAEENSYRLQIRSYLQKKLVDKFPTIPPAIASTPW